MYILEKPRTWRPKPRLSWFTLEYWKYIFHQPRTFRKVWCRLCGHPCGCWYYNTPESLEPDWSCKNCDDELQ